MRILLIILLTLISQRGFSQSAMKAKLLADFAESRKDPNSLQRAWFSKDDNTFDSRDTIIFYNYVNYQAEHSQETSCQFIGWQFISTSTFQQSYYSVCEEPPRISIAVDGSDKYRFKLKVVHDTLILQVINYKGRMSQFKISHNQSHDSASRVDYPIMTLIRLHSKEL
jgi:hypothetical protein